MIIYATECHYVIEWRVIDLESNKTTVLKCLKEMDNYLATANNNINEKIVADSLNKFIDLFLLISNMIDNDIEKRSSEFTLNLSALLVDTVETFNKKNQNVSPSTFVMIKSVFDNWSGFLKRNLKYKIVVFGINELSLIIDKLIDPEKADIVSFIADTDEHVGKHINNIEIVEPNAITQKPFDFIINVSIHEQLSIQLKTIVGSDRFIDYLFLKRLIVSSPEFYIKHFDFLSSEKIFSGILTGLSYVQKGVNEKQLRGKFFNLANPAQDLFYDFEMIKYAFGFKEIREHLRHVIIGLSYYSFHYDLSKSVNESRVNYYYPITKTMHNNKLADNYLIYHDQLEQIEEEILRKEHFSVAFEPQKAYFEKIISDDYTKQYDCQKRSDEELVADIASIKRDFNKNYPVTVSENKKILKEYLNYLQLNSIKPIIIVCPVTKLYQAFTPLNFQRELYEIIADLSLEHKFQFLDYYHSNEFDDSDFTDPSHMNDKGAKKFAEILNRDIAW